jgi:Fur family ferric uptake transcriptional regulator
VGTASVYRALDLLQSEGLVARIEVGDGGARYEPALPGGEHHHHVVCDVCAAITPFEDAGLERAIHDVSSRIGHEVSGHEVLIKGRCRNCARSAT